MYLKRGQAAMEFLASYGWTILVAIVAIGALNVFWERDSAGFVSESCILGPGLFCKDFVVHEDSINLVVLNSLGRDLSEISINHADCSNPPSNYVLENGEELIFTMSGCSFNSNELVNEDLNLSYMFEGSSINHIRNITVTAIVQAAMGILSLETNVDDGGISSFWNLQINNSESITIVDDISRNGDYSLKFNVSYLDYAVPADWPTNKSRAELSLREEYADQYPMNGEPIFYGWSIYFPPGYEYNISAPDNFNIIGQWFHRPDIGNGQTWEDWFDLYDGKRMPPSLHLEYAELITGEKGIGLVWKPTPETPAASIAEKEINLGEWNDIIFEIKWSTDTDGYIRGWLNGELFTADPFYGINMYNPTPKNLKVGLYRGPSARMNNYVYYDEIRIGGTYEEVDPNNY